MKVSGSVSLKGVSDSDTRQVTVFSLLTLNHCLLDRNSLVSVPKSAFEFCGGLQNGGMVLRRNLKASREARTESELV